MKSLFFSTDMSAVGLDHVLKDTDIPALSEVLARISDKWEELANALGLPGHLVAQCCKNTFVLSMNAVMREWIAGNGRTPITLGTLKTKLESTSMGEKGFAMDLIANFNKEKFAGASPPQSTSPEAATPGCVADSACTYVILQNNSVGVSWILLAEVSVHVFEMTVLRWLQDEQV